MMIVNDDSSGVSEQSFLLIDDTRGVIYDRHMFIIQATGRVHWSYAQIIFLGQLCQPGDINKDPTVWLVEAKPPPKYVSKNYMSLTNSKI